MLNVYSVSLSVCRELVPVIAVIKRRDRGLADQLRRAVQSVPLNIAEGDGQVDGNRRQRRLSALGSAREVVSCLDVARAMSYVVDEPDGVRGKLDHIIGVLVRVAVR